MLIVILFTYVFVFAVGCVAGVVAARIVYRPERAKGLRLKSAILGGSRPYRFAVCNVYEARVDGDFDFGNCWCCGRPLRGCRTPEDLDALIGTLPFFPAGTIATKAAPVFALFEARGSPLPDHSGA